MLHTIILRVLDGLALVVPIALVVRLGGRKVNWTMLAAILASAIVAHSVQAGFELPECVFPVLCGAFVGICVLLAMSPSKGRVARGQRHGNAG
ncbi:hypothetical protein NRY95_04200 [Xanthomonas campestris pv. phormiicola]|nr:hypothetical protein [Xanthomonas campestris pv. phormiicola]UYC17178.1 hypothetical protein NRY95_04200 [Xanthomonas campestris pv. phormiicola]